MAASECFIVDGLLQCNLTLIVTPTYDLLQKMEYENNTTTDLNSTTTTIAPEVGAYLFLGLMLPVSCVILIGNSLVLITPWKFPRLGKKHHVFLINIAIADLTTGLLATPVVLIQELKPEWNSWYFFCVGRITIVYVCACASNLLLLAATVERYIAIHYPFYYEKTCTSKVLAMSCGIIWLYSTSVGASVSLGWNNWSPDELCFTAHVCTFSFLMLAASQILAVLVVIVGLYARIFHTARMQANHIEENSIAVSNIRHTTTGLKAAKVTAMVIVAYMICFIPYVFTCCLASVHLFYRWGSLHEVYTHFATPFSLTSVFLYLNAVTNPIIYHGVMPTFRSAVKSLLGCDRSRTIRVATIDGSTLANDHHLMVI